MDAAARLVVGLDGRGHTVPSTLRGEAPLLMRVTEAGRRLQVHLVGGAAGPLGGDRLDLSVAVGPGAALEMRSVAATLVQPGTCCASASRASVTAEVAGGATLDWWPEPLVSVMGSDHTQITTVQIADDSATVRWVDEVVLGRHDEAGGRLTMQQRITVGGSPVLHHTVAFGPATAGTGRHGSGRIAVTGVLIGRPARTSAAVIESDHRVVRYPISPTCTAWIALADSLDVARRALADLGMGSCAIDEPETPT